jgi:hypothetical protein
MRPTGGGSLQLTPGYIDATGMVDGQIPIDVVGVGLNLALVALAGMGGGAVGVLAVPEVLTALPLARLGAGAGAAGVGTTVLLDLHNIETVGEAMNAACGG